MVMLFLALSALAQDPLTNKACNQLKFTIKQRLPGQAFTYGNDELDLGKVFPNISIRIPVVIDNQSGTTDCLRHFQSPSRFMTGTHSKDNAVNLEMKKGENHVDVHLDGFRLNPRFRKNAKMDFYFCRRADPYEGKSQYNHYCKVKWEFDDRAWGATRSLKLEKNDRSYQGTMELWLRKRFRKAGKPNFDFMLCEYAELAHQSLMEWDDAAHSTHAKLLINLEIDTSENGPNARLIQAQLKVSESLTVPFLIEFPKPGFDSSIQIRQNLR